MDNLEQFKKAAVGLGYSPSEVEAFASLVKASPRSTVTGMTPLDEAKYVTQQTIQNEADIAKAKALQPITVETEVKKKEATSPLDVKQAVDIEREKTSLTQKNQVADLENKATNLETLIGSLEAQGPIAGRIGLLIANVSGGAANKNIKTYESIKNSLKSPLARVLGGEKGNLSDKDIERMGILPEVSDSPEVAKRKLNYIRTVISQTRKIYGIPDTVPTQLMNTSPSLSTTPNLKRDQVIQKLKGAGYSDMQINQYLQAKGL